MSIPTWKQKINGLTGKIVIPCSASPAGTKKGQSIKKTVPDFSLTNWFN